MFLDLLKAIGIKHPLLQAILKKVYTRGIFSLRNYVFDFTSFNYLKPFMGCIYQNQYHV